MPKIYFYKIVVDDGGAPCVHNGLLSLAICKPMIRRTANKDDIIIGFAAKSLHADNRLIYVARVTEKLVNGDYFKNSAYITRPDCIYEWKDNYFFFRKGSLYHGPSDLVHDLGHPPVYSRANTFLSTKFCYFGALGSANYKQNFSLVAKAVANLGRGHRVHHDACLYAELEQLATNNLNLNRLHQGKPSSQPRCGVSHRGGNCGCSVVWLEQETEKLDTQAFLSS